MLEIKPQLGFTSRHIQRKRKYWNEYAKAIPEHYDFKAHVRERLENWGGLC